MKLSYKAFNIILLTVISVKVMCQPIVVDKIAGVVGKNQILYSEVEDQYLQLMAQKVSPIPSKCEIFEDLLAQKLLVNQAAIDSLVVDEGQVEMELNDRINYFISQVGTEERLVEYFGKSIIEIKEDMRDAVRDQLLMQMMRREITSGLSVTPSEVRVFYRDLPEDSIPFVDAEVEINQILFYPATSDDAKFAVREKLLSLRQRIIEGDNFATLAVLYSEGPSARRGGDIGWSARAELDPAYAKAAFALKEGQVSKIVESSFGYHIIQLIERNEDRVHTRHILMKPVIPFEEKEIVINKMDSIISLVRLDSLTFEQAAFYYSQDEDSKINGGMLVNPYTGNTHFKLDQFDTKEYYIIRDLKIGEISEIFESTDDKGNLVYKVIRLKSKTEPHTANLKQDYEMLKQMTTQNKQNEIVDEWIEEKIKTTYIRISDPYCNCSFRLKGWH